jgi:hypothetical protein
MHTIVETNAYLSEVKALGMTQFEQDTARDFLARNPQSGDIVQGTGGVRKVRFAKEARARAAAIA